VGCLAYRCHRHNSHIATLYMNILFTFYRPLGIRRTAIEGPLASSVFKIIVVKNILKALNQFLLTVIYYFFCC